MFDLAELQENLDNDQELIAEILQLYLDDAPLLVGTITSSFADRNTEAVRVAAHTLKGMAANMCMQPLAVAAGAIEEAAKTGSAELGDLILGLGPLEQKSSAEVRSAAKAFPTV